MLKCVMRIENKVKLCAQFHGNATEIFTTFMEIKFYQGSKYFIGVCNLTYLLCMYINKRYA